MRERHPVPVVTRCALGEALDGFVVLGRQLTEVPPLGPARPVALISRHRSAG